MKLTDLTVKLFADGAEKFGMLEMNEKLYISGFTTNPILMRKAGITDYVSFAKDILTEITDKPISFEVFSDELDDMFLQAKEIASWGENVFIKIPITNTKGISCIPLIKNLSDENIKINATALMTVEQVEEVIPALENNPEAYISVFAGRIADTGVDPVPIMKKCVDLLSDYPNIELIWASPRELFNVIQANDVGCHIITATNSILAKLDLLEKDLTEFSLDTVKMFYNDANEAGYSILAKQESDISVK